MCEHCRAEAGEEIAALRAEVERLKGERDAERKGRLFEYDERFAALNDLSSARARVEELERALRRIAEGNLGPAQYQADYACIREVARSALHPSQADEQEKA